MGKMLLISEKPSQMRSWAAALGGTSGVYKGQPYVITHALGHLFELKSPHDLVPADKSNMYATWSIVSLPWDETDFTWAYKKRHGSADICKAIKAAAKGCDIIAFAGDTDPSGEGDVITYEVITQLGLSAKRYVRLNFADESVDSLRKAFENPVDIPDIHNHPPVRKALLRAHWDYIGGMQYTRLCTLLAGQKNKLLRNGRLKSSMIILVGDQLKAVEDYVRKPFFQNRFKDENGVVYTNAEEMKYDNKEDVPDIYHDSAVVCDSRKMKKTAPPKLIDLATLAGRLAPKGVSSKSVLSMYQKMYEKQIVSYPRTEDKKITKEQFNDLLPYVDAIARVVGVDAALVNERKPRKTHIGTGLAHGANRPGPHVPKSLADLDREFGRGAGLIYEILAKSYLAMMCPDYEYEQQKGHVADYPAFVGSANVPKFLGWKAVYDDDNDDESEDNVAAGLGKLAKPFVYEGANPKPQMPTVKWLMGRLAKHDIGTGATRTATVADITKKDSAKSKNQTQIMVEKRGKLTFAECGEMSYRMLKGTHIADLATTKHVQDEMSLVAEGKAQEASCLHEIQKWIRDDIPVMTLNAEAMRKDMGLQTSDQLDASRVHGVWNGKAVSYKGSFGGHTFSDEENEALLRGEEIWLKGLISQRTGNPYNCWVKLAVLTYKKRSYVGIEPRFETQNNSGADTDYATGVYSGRGKHKGETVRFKRLWSGHSFSDEEVADLLAGKKISFEATSRAGNPYTATGKLADQTYKGRSYFGFKLELNKRK